MSSREDRVLDRIRSTPEGFVRAYGDVSPGAPRFAGTVLASNDDPDLPWWRIVRADEGDPLRRRARRHARGAAARLLAAPECAVRGRAGPRRAH